MQNRIVFSLIGVLFFAACSRKQSETATVDTNAAAQKQQIKIEPVTGSPQYPDAKLTIVSPREGQVLKKAMDSVLVVMQVSGIQLATPTSGDSTRGIAYSKQGQHVHVIVDDKPYMADYKNGQPFNVGVLAPGMHTIRAFPSYSWHESIKSKNAFAVRTFAVKEAQWGGSMGDGMDLRQPLLTYSRPKGTYTGAEANKVLLDFYIANCTLADSGYHVKLWIDDAAQPDIVKWQPYFIEGLSKGKHKIALQLTDEKGHDVPGIYNHPAQIITVE
jgi:hypothetical protein